jgi:hypothetical protein
LTRRDKILSRILRGNADADIRFTELINLLENLGFQMRIKGDHHILTKSGVDEILNLQPRSGKAKPYQVKQVRNVLTTYGLLATEPEEEGEK